ncbi:hypothetical protein BCU49_011135 [Vibrio breoganii]|nr:hypothetical protein [Vibrio breoganii]PMI20750.1 hypothetical protein BCU49_06245 [Vibrio breoganii]
MQQSKTKTGRDGRFELPDSGIKFKGLLGTMAAKNTVEKSKNDVMVFNSIIEQGKLSNDNSNDFAWGFMCSHLKCLGVHESLNRLYMYDDVALSIVEWLKKSGAENQNAYHVVLADILDVFLAIEQCEQKGNFREAKKLSSGLFLLGFKLNEAMFESEIVAGTSRSSHQDNVYRKEKRMQNKDAVLKEAIEIMQDKPNISMRSLAMIIDSRNIVEVGFETIRMYLKEHQEPCSSLIP